MGIKRARKEHNRLVRVDAVRVRLKLLGYRDIERGGLKRESGIVV